MELLSLHTNISNVPVRDYAYSNLIFFTTKTADHLRVRSMKGEFPVPENSLR